MVAGKGDCGDFELCLEPAQRREHDTVRDVVFGGASVVGEALLHPLPRDSLSPSARLALPGPVHVGAFAQRWESPGRVVVELLFPEFRAARR